jgi:serine/threonine protein kinase
VSNALQQLRDGLAGRYDVIQELGAGGMATVYLARDLKHGRDVAVKVMRPEIAQSLGRDRFLLEIQLAARLSHPHILPLFDSGEAAGALYYVMPRVEGPSLRDRLVSGKQLAIDEAVRIAAGIAGALDYAHRHGVVHRDIKPENILLQDGHPLVADFGIGLLFGAAGDELMTHTGVTLGTPAYMSPEQAVGDDVDGRSDLYSLGCVLYETLVGEPPFTGPNVQAVIAKRFVQIPADVTALRPGISRTVALALQRSLARTPIDRFDTAAEFATALLAVDGRQSADAAVPERSIAVMPFTSLSSDIEDEYFADGITEEILNALARVPDLKVAGRSSSFSFKGQRQDLRRVGEQLRVRAILEGSVRRSGKRVRITAQLLDAADGYQRWSQRYDREIEDVFALQDEIAGTIATKLEATLVVGKTSEQRATHSIEAYEAYLKGRALLARRGKSIVDGLACMERALELDPEYGLAWAGVAEGYLMLGYYGMITPELAREKAVPAAERAVQHAPDVAEAHSALGAATMMYEWEQRDRTARAFQRAMELNPLSPTGATWYYHFYLAWAGGQTDAGVRGMRALHDNDPLSPYLCGMMSILLGSLHQPEAMEWASRALALAPDAFLSRFSHQIAAAAAGDWDLTISDSEALFAIGGRSPAPLSIYAFARHRRGEREAAAVIYEEIKTMTNQGERAPLILACVAADLGREEEATQFCRQAIRRRDGTIYAYGCGRLTSVEALRKLPVFQELLSGLQLPAHPYRHLA